MAMRKKAAFSNPAIFQYKIQKGPLHKVPAMFKLLALLPLSIIFLTLPLRALVPAIAAAALAAFFCRITASEQAGDLRPAFFYAAFMYAASALSSISDAVGNLENGTRGALFWAALVPQQPFVLLFLRLVLIMQLSALLFRSTSLLEMRCGLGGAELAARRFSRRFLRRFLRRFSQKKGDPLEASYSQIIAVFFSFIPEIFESWRQFNLAWQGRGGKRGLKKTKTLVFALVALSMEKAARKAAALQARSASTRRFSSRQDTKAQRREGGPD